MKVGRWRLLSLAVALFLPLQAGAFSFGSFTPGDKIVSIQLSAAVSTGVVFSTGGNPASILDDTLTFESSVSTITMLSGAVFSPILGTVLVSSSVKPVAGSQFFSNTLIGTDLVNGIVADLSITDIGIGGSGLLLSADYVLPGVTFTASQFFPGFPITSSLSGDFDVTGGNASFTAAFGSQGNFYSTLAAFKKNGSPVTSLCALTNGVPVGSNCLGPTDFANFTAQPTTTIVPLVPEPSASLLLLICGAMLGIALKR
jgi:hypothetical protein